LRVRVRVRIRVRVEATRRSPRGSRRARRDRPPRSWLLVRVRLGLGLAVLPPYL